MAVKVVRLFAEKGPSDLRQQDATEDAYLGEMARLGLYAETD